MKVDLHLHSEYSWDSKVPIIEYIRKAERLGIGAISITDHNNTDSHNVIQEMQKQTDVLLVPGQEINTSDGHLLIYGWIPTVARDLSMYDTVQEARRLAGDKTAVCVAAHPFDRFRGGKGKLVFDTGIDGIETLNASALLKRFNNQARDHSNKLDIIKLGNSDSHRLEEFSFAWTAIEPAKTVEEVLSTLKTGNVKGKIIGMRKKTSRFLARKIRGTS